MKKLRIKILKIVIVVLTVHISLLLTGYDYMWKAVIYNFPDINDYEIFANTHINKSPRPQAWKESEEYNKQTLSLSLQNTLEKYKSTAFLVIKDGEVVHEQYWQDYDQASISNSFSMSKSFISALIGCAIDDGYIKNVNQPVGDYLEAFTVDGKEKITIRHLLQMTSGLSWVESYNGPFSITTRAYYDDDLPEVIASLDAETKPGEEFVYRSGDTQVLSFVLEKATGYTTAEYAHLKLWTPLGAESDALWSLDRERGHEKAYCCINATARDFARLGSLYLNRGMWDGERVLSEAYIKESFEPSFLFDPQSKRPCNFYGYQWWLIPEYKGCNIFYARGILGQFIIGIPEKNIVIVRLGHERGEKKDGIHHVITYAMIDEILEMYP